MRLTVGFNLGRNYALSIEPTRTLRERRVVLCLNQDVFDSLFSCLGLHHPGVSCSVSLLWFDRKSLLIVSWQVWNRALRRGRGNILLALDVQTCLLLLLIQTASSSVEWYWARGAASLGHRSEYSSREKNTQNKNNFEYFQAGHSHSHCITRFILKALYTLYLTWLLQYHV